MSRSEFVDFIEPLGNRLQLYDPYRLPHDQPTNDAADPAKAVPQGFIDAMEVRHAVFVEEQSVPAENELDPDDPLSYHWVAYASVPLKYNSPDLKPQDEKMDDKQRKSSGTSTKIPIGTIRLVPPVQHPYTEVRYEIEMQKKEEMYVKLGRLAVIKEFRKAGISKLLIETALQFIRERPNEFVPQVDAGTMEDMRRHGTGLAYNGLVLVHAQTGVQKVWKKYGFETDESMGTWDEEGMEHVGMWKRIDVAEGRRKSKIVLPGSP